MIDQGLGLKVSPYDDLLVPSIVTRNTKWNYTFVFFHYTWWRAAPDDCSQWHNSYVTNMSCPPPPLQFHKNDADIYLCKYNYLTIYNYIWNYWNLNPCLCYNCVVSINTYKFIALFRISWMFIIHWS